MGNFNFRDIKHYVNFMQGAQSLLTQTLENFFSAKVRLLYEPLRELMPAYNTDFSLCWERYVYILSNDMVLIVPRVQTNDNNIYYMAILVEGPEIGKYNKRSIFHYLAASISYSLYDSYIRDFWDSVVYFDERLILRAVSNYLAKGKFNRHKINNLLTKFNALRSTTFEGKYFSTGLIVAATLADYKKDADNGGRSGVVMGLHNTQRVYDDIDTRFWYLADGVNSLYLSDIKETIHYMFIYKNSDNNDTLI